MSTVTKSIGTTSRDYSTITLWEADLDNAGVYAATNDALGECYNDSVFDESVTINGGGTIGLNSVTLSVASGQRHTGIAGTGARVVASVANRALVPIPLAGTDKLIVEWLEWDANAKAYTVTLMNTGSEAAGRVTVAQRMIVHGYRTANASLCVMGESQTPTRDLRVQDCIVYDNSATASNRTLFALSLDSDQANGGCLNNTVYGTTGNGTGAGVNIFCNTDSANARVRNNISMGSAGTSPLDFKWPATQTNIVSGNNLSSDATADDPGDAGDVINAVAANQFVSLVGGSEDFHLKAGAAAIDAGVDLVTTPAGVNFDIDNRDRDALGDVWDIGADEFVATGRTTKNTRSSPLGMEIGMDWRGDL